jgi:hypothetical protein
MAKNPLDSFLYRFSFKNNFSIDIILPREKKLKSVGLTPGSKITIPGVKTFNLDAITASLATEYQSGFFNFCYVSQKEVQLSFELYEMEGNTYHTMFASILKCLYDSYPDDSFFQIKVYKYADWGDRDDVEVIYDLSYCWLTNVSTLTFEASSNDVQTVTVQFVTDPKCITINRTNK